MGYLEVCCLILDIFLLLIFYLVLLKSENVFYTISII